MEVYIGTYMVGLLILFSTSNPIQLPHVWNSMPTEKQEWDITLGKFRRALKTHLYGHWELQHRVAVFRVLFTNSTTYLLTYLHEYD